MVYKLVALALASVGAWLMHSGIAAREAIEPSGFVAGAGFLPATGETPDASRADGSTAFPGEVRSSAVVLVAPSVAAAGGTRRSAGLGLLAASLALAWATAFGVRREAGGASTFPWLPTVLLLPAGYLLFRLGVDVSRRVPSALEARTAFTLWGPAVGLALVLSLARSRTRPELPQ